jgi:hypothetical protein
VGEGRPPTQPNVLSCIADSCATNHMAEVDYRSAPGAERRLVQPQAPSVSQERVARPPIRCPPGAVTRVILRRGWQPSKQVGDAP